MEAGHAERDSFDMCFHRAVLSAHPNHGCHDVVADPRAPAVLAVRLKMLAGVRERPDGDKVATQNRLCALFGGGLCGLVEQFYVPIRRFLGGHPEYDGASRGRVAGGVAV